MNHIDRVTEHNAHSDGDSVFLVASQRSPINGRAYWGIGLCWPVLCGCTPGGCWRGHAHLLGLN